MANATNLMSIGQVGSASTGSRSKLGAQYSASKMSKQNSKSDFGAHLDKANERNNPAPQDKKEIKPEEKNSEQVKPETENTDATEKTSSQGKSNEPQDAPQNKNEKTNSNETPENLRDAGEKSGEVSTLADVSYLFAAGPETLLATQVAPQTDGESNLMTIIPQKTDENSRNMLDLLGGKTWQNSDVELSIQPEGMKIEEQPDLNLTPQELKQVLNQIPAQNQNQIQTQPELTQNQNPVQPEVQMNPELNQIQTQAQPELTQTQNPVQTQVQPELTTQNQNPMQQVQPELPAQNQPQPELTQNQNQIPQQVQPELTTQNQNPIQTQSQPATQQQQFGAEIQPILNSEQAPVDNSQVTRQNISEVLGVNVQVEDNRGVVPEIVVQQTPQQFENEMRNAGQDLPEFAENETQQQNSGAGENFNSHLSPVSQTTQTQQPGAVQNPEPIAAPRDDFNIRGQIVEQARMIRTAENTEMVINLRPDHLGALTLRISVSQNGAMTASFYSDNAQVRTIIENSLVQLKQELENNGIKVEDVEVYAGLSEDSLMNGQGGQAWQQNQRGGGNNPRRINLDSLNEEFDAAGPVNEALVEDGVDYKV